MFSLTDIVGNDTVLPGAIVIGFIVWVAGGPMAFQPSIAPFALPQKVTVVAGDIPQVQPSHELTVQRLVYAQSLHHNVCEKVW